jgi:hypothetical protein
MHERQEIEGKTSGTHLIPPSTLFLMVRGLTEPHSAHHHPGKQAVYHYPQPLPSDPSSPSASSSSSPTTLADLDTHIAALRSRLAAAKSTATRLRTELAPLRARPAPAELAPTVAALRRQRDGLSARVAALQNTGAHVPPVSEHEKATIHAEHAQWSGHVATRRSIFAALWRICVDFRPEGVSTEELIVRLAPLLPLFPLGLATREHTTDLPCGGGRYRSSWAVRAM